MNKLKVRDPLATAVYNDILFRFFCLIHYINLFTFIYRNKFESQVKKHMIEVEYLN